MFESRVSVSGVSDAGACPVNRRTFLTGTVLGISAALTHSATAVSMNPASKEALATRLQTIPTVCMGYPEFTEDPRVEFYRPPAMIGASAKLPDYQVLT